MRIAVVSSSGMLTHFLVLRLLMPLLIKQSVKYDDEKYTESILVFVFIQLHLLKYRTFSIISTYLIRDMHSFI